MYNVYKNCRLHRPTVYDVCSFYALVLFGITIRVHRRIYRPESTNYGHSLIKYLYLQKFCMKKKSSAYYCLYFFKRIHACAFSIFFFKSIIMFRTLIIIIHSYTAACCVHGFYCFCHVRLNDAPFRLRMFIFVFFFFCLECPQGNRITCVHIFVSNGEGGEKKPTTRAIIFKGFLCRQL